MAQQAYDGYGAVPARFTENRLPQFTGGQTDPATGNLVPGNRVTAAQPGIPTPPAAPEPAKPVTKLADVGNEPMSIAPGNWNALMARMKRAAETPAPAPPTDYGGFGSPTFNAPSFGGGAAAAGGGVPGSMGGGLPAAMGNTFGSALTAAMFKTAPRA